MDKCDLRAVKIISGILLVIATVFLFVSLIFVPYSMQKIPVDVDAHIEQCRITIDNYESLFTDEIVGIEAKSQKEIPLEYRRTMEHCRASIARPDLQHYGAWLRYYIVWACTISLEVVLLYLFLRSRRVLNSKENKNKGQFDEVNW